MKHLWISSFYIILITSSCYSSEKAGWDDWENVFHEQSANPQLLKSTSTIIEQKLWWSFPIAKKIRSSFSSTNQQQALTTLMPLPTTNESTIPIKIDANNSSFIVNDDKPSGDDSIQKEVKIITLDTLKRVTSVEANLETTTSTINQTDAKAFLLHLQKSTELKNFTASTFTDNTLNNDSISSSMPSKDTTTYNSYQQSSNNKTNDTQTTSTDEDVSLYSLCFGCCKKKAIKTDELSQSTMSNDDPKKKAKLIEFTHFIDAMIRV